MTVTRALALHCVKMEVISAERIVDLLNGLCQHVSHTTRTGWFDSLAIGHTFAVERP